VACAIAAPETASAARAKLNLFCYKTPKGVTGKSSALPLFNCPKL